MILIESYLAIVTLALTTVVSVITAIYMWQKNKRERETREDAIEDRNLKLLEDQNELLREQLEEYKQLGEQREKEWLKRECEWRKREARLEAIVDEIRNKYEDAMVEWQRKYDDLLDNITRMKYCLNAGYGCQTYNPGGQRATDDMDGILDKIGGTD